jgi:hypothetical protein
MTHQWSLDRETGEKLCFSCEKKAVRVYCGALKLEEFDQLAGEVLVYHVGEHVCVPRPNNRKSKEVMREAIAANAHLGPKQMQREVITRRIKDHDWEGAARLASELQDTRQLRYLKRRSGKHSVVDRNSISVVGQLKAAMSQQKGWEFYIYEVNDKALNNRENYVFKSSKVAGQLMLECEEGGALEGETLYFDGMHKRVRGYTTLTLWVFHPSLRKLLRLATMEVKGENTANIASFFQTVDRMLTDICGVPHRFKPSQILVDENGANFKAIKEVYGAQKVYGCQFHFMNNAQLRARMLSAEHEAKFMEVCSNMCEVATFDRYMELTDEIVRLADGNNEIIKWFDWWDLRRYHLFPAFRGYMLTNVNMAEAGQSGMTTDKPQMILDAAYDDTSYMVAQDFEVIKFQGGQGKSSGKGPSQQQVLYRDHESQRKRVKEYIEVLKKNPKMPSLAQLLRNVQAATFEPRPSDSHKPPKRMGRPRKRKMPMRRRRIRSPAHDSEDSDSALRDDSEWMSLDRTSDGVGPTHISSDETESQFERRVGMAEGSPDLRSTVDTVRTPKPIRPPVTQHSTANPVILKLREGNISRCQGCHMEINKEETKYPRNMVFSTKAHRSWMNKQTGRFQTNVFPSPIYFHLDVICVKKYYEPEPWQMEEMRVENTVFDQLSEVQLDYLNDLGYLQYLVV